MCDSPEHFYCAVDNKCLSSAAVCNGLPECSNGEDEFNCTDVHVHVCEPHEFDCKDGKIFFNLFKY